MGLLEISTWTSHRCLKYKTKLVFFLLKADRLLRRPHVSEWHHHSTIWEGRFPLLVKWNVQILVSISPQSFGKIEKKETAQMQGTCKNSLSILSIVTFSIKSSRPLLESSSHWPLATALLPSGPRRTDEGRAPTPHLGRDSSLAWQPSQERDRSSFSCG